MEGTDPGSTTSTPVSKPRDFLKLENGKLNNIVKRAVVLKPIRKRKRAEREIGPGAERVSQDDDLEEDIDNKESGFVGDLHNQVIAIENEINQLSEMTSCYALNSYFKDLTEQLLNLSHQVNDRIFQLSHLDEFLQHHQGAPCTAVNSSYFSVLPIELNIHIMSFLSVKDLLVASLINKEFQAITQDEGLWRHLCDNRWKGLRTNSQAIICQRRRVSRKRIKQSWKEVFKYRKSVDENWRKGRYSRVLTLTGHESQVCCCQYDNEKIISGSFDSKIKVWDIKNLELKTSKKDNFIRRDNYITRAWNTNSIINEYKKPTSAVECVRTFEKTETNNAHTDRVLCLMFEGNRLVTGGRDESVKIWDLEAGLCTQTLIGHKDNVWYLQFDEQKIVSGSADKLICFWDSRSGKCYQTLKGHERGLSCLHFEDNLLMSGSADKTIRLWDIRYPNKERRILEGHTDAVYCLYYYDGKLISGGEDKTAKVWDLDMGECTATLSGNPATGEKGHTGAIYCMQFNDTRLVTGSYDHTIKVWDLDSKECLHTFGGPKESGLEQKVGEFHTNTVRCIQFDLLKMVSASADKTIKIWDMQSDGGDEEDEQELSYQL
eukprot:TRINITY_DN11823_c0_g1_i1.p1 TRINITY_DN11823_c0_g1~~TRINITY_DN11823_c0_g1_i1.p1  ORF type:complete len:603 (+),score=78.03 TRINITY_DN11823_c0_g1_i1:111-1919(+)